MATFLAIAALFLGAVNSASSDSDDSSSDDWRLDYMGQSTQFRIYNPYNKKQTLKIKMSNLIEYDGVNNTATKNKVSSFASTDWDWLNIDGVNAYYRDSNISIIRNVFQAYDILDDNDDDVNFNLTTIFFKEDAEIQGGVFGLENTVKFNVDITNWPFLNEGNYLKLCINLNTNNPSSSSDSADSADSDSDRRRRMASSDDDSPDSDDSEDSSDDEANNWRAGDFNIYVLDNAECDGSNDTLTVSSEDEGSLDGSQRNICLRFEYCESGDIYYDPIVTYLGSNEANTVDAVAIGLGVGFGVIGLCGLIGLGYYCYRKKGKGEYQGLLYMGSDNDTADKTDATQLTEGQ